MRATPDQTDLKQGIAGGPDGALAGHVVESVDALVDFHKHHYSNASFLQRGIDHLTDILGRPLFVLALIADEKNAKIISLLEELRRDQPGVAGRIDRESDEMSKPADPKAVLAEIEDRGFATAPRLRTRRQRAPL